MRISDWSSDVCSSDLRPCVVVAVDAAKRQVIVAPLTTKGERYPNTLPVPSVVAKGASLSGATAVVLDDLNIFTWLGYDVRPLHDTDSVYIGRFPPGFTASIMLKLLPARPTHRVIGIASCRARVCLYV